MAFYGTFGRKKVDNAAIAQRICLDDFENNTLSFHQCVCQKSLNITHKYSHCRAAATIEEENALAEYYHVAIGVGVVVLVLLLAVVTALVVRHRRAHIQAWLEQQVWWLRCCGGRAAREDRQWTSLSNEDQNPCARCLYSQTVLGCLELCCDCDIFRTKRSRAFVMPLPKKKPPVVSLEPTSVEMQSLPVYDELFDKRQEILAGRGRVRVAPTAPPIIEIHT